MIPSPFASSSIMPSSSIVRYRDNIELCVPTGFRFRPTDRQLVEEFLAKRVLGEPFADYLIPDVNVYCCNPDQLPLDIVKGPERWAYFFTLTTQRYQKGSQWNRTTPGGHWKASGMETGIQVGEETVAFSRKLVFYRGNSPLGTKTQYIMQEYRINKDLDRFKNLADPKMANCVICKVYTKKPSSQCTMLMPRTTDRRARKVQKRSEAEYSTNGDADVKAVFNQLEYLT